MRNRVFVLLAAASIVVAACGPAATTAPTGAPTSGPSGEPPPTGAPGEQTLAMVMDGDISGGLSNAADNVPTFEAAQLLYNGIYGYDASITPYPDLADGPAEISADGKTWTITLRSGITFHDGTDLGADDVVQTYEIAQSDNCRYNPSICLSTFLEGVRAVDDLIVEFTLTDPLATFATLYLPGIWIDSKDAVDASYERYLDKVNQISAADTKAFLDKVTAEETTPTGPPDDTGAPTVDYAQFLDEAKDLLTRAGQELPSEADFQTDSGLDEGGYTGELITRIKAVDATFTASATDALAAAYPYLDYQTNPAGTGPFKFVSFRVGENLEFAANEDYFEGAPSISRVFIPIIKDDIAGGQALVAGQVDWKYSLEGATYNQIQSDPNVKFVEYPDFGFFSLYFNLREGRLFTDVRLRQAVNYCFDKIRTVEVATEGQGVAIYSDIPPASWAFPTEGLETYDFDPAAGIALLEEAGWTDSNGNGIRDKDGVELSTVAGVRAGRPNRSAFMQLLGDQARENCGIDIQYKEIDFNALLTMLDNFPHINAAAPETNRPADAYFGGFGTSFDPDPFALYHSSQCSTAENPSTFNTWCAADPEMDRLIDAGLMEFDQAERAEIYQEYAIRQAEILPVIYAWSDIAREGLRNTVDSAADGGLSLDSPQFFWELNKLTNVVN
jgi:ABC-type transport system substrate-binding protein